eukprot:3592045-Ditylum_brightwellii.AAC.1
MIMKHTAVLIIQTNFCLACQQCILYDYNGAFIDWNNHNDFNNENKEDKDIVNALISSFTLDLDKAIGTFVAISKSSNSSDSDNNLISVTAPQSTIFHWP